jgi:hypothetical protein
VHPKVFLFFILIFIGKLHMHPVGFVPDLTVHPFLWKEEVPFVGLDAQNLQSSRQVGEADEQINRAKEVKYAQNCKKNWEQ